MNTTPARDPAPAADTHLAEAAARPVPEPAVNPVRLARLFRHTVRTSGVNPLLHLMPRLLKERLP